MLLAVFLILDFSSADAQPASHSQNLFADGQSIELQVGKNMAVEFVAPIGSPAPRFFASGPDGEFILGSRGGTLYRLRYPYDDVERLVSLKGYYHSAAYRNGRLYAAETAGVWSAPYAGAEAAMTAGSFQRDFTLPSLTGGHSSRTIITGPDNRLYIGLGISGNCSDEYLNESYPFEQRRGGVFVYENKKLKPFSSGLRNPIGLAFHPVSGQLFATNAGPDNLGYDLPPEILTPLLQDSYHGMPWFQYYGGKFHSGQCAQGSPPLPASRATKPLAFFDARSTPQGIAFLEGSSLGEEYDTSAVVAIHGSWATRPGLGKESRRAPKITLVFFDGKTARVEDLVTGFQRIDGSRFARPCGIAVGKDGHIYFTSDGGDVTGLFRIVPRRVAVPAIGTLLESD